MRIFLTGGSGNLGQVLTYHLQKQNDEVVCFDLHKPLDGGQFIQGSILDREQLSNSLKGVDCLVHIAAWHGIHEFTGEKNSYDFWDLNVTGSFNVFQAAVKAGIKNILLISSETVLAKESMYGWTKDLTETIAERFVACHKLNVLTLRPRAFIPYWNKAVYSTYLDWARWFWKGAVHINDVAQAVLLGLKLLTSQTLNQQLILPVDGAYEYTDCDLDNWNPELTFKKYYPQYYELALMHGLDPSVKPIKQDISQTIKWLNYQPKYSLANLLQDLAIYGGEGPPINFELNP